MSCFPGSVPLDPQLSSSLEEGKNFMQMFPDSAAFSAINTICQTLLSNLEIAWTFFFCKHPKYSVTLHYSKGGNKCFE